MTELNLDGYTPLPAGKIAAVVTYLEMATRPAEAIAEPLPLRPVARPDLAWYRAFYAAIGLDWLWTSRLLMDDAALGAILHHPDNALFVADGTAGETGIVEIDRRDPADVEIAFFGLKPGATGQGLGLRMMAAALAEAWRPEARRVWLHTCTLDHPAALSFYRRCGFAPFRQAIEVLDDPRVTGRIPREAAPRTPIIG
ncbi:MAG: GNAT family N-acetyltransferase [Phreatobacter sp.]|uniref:GNAT family N-acetyltransferase n=1 Tax=Phreatobacter sp. TaxID=1966341 RepID=UPI002736904A|nr:GNAT family N-acetyltransferase [Phreatobacter sp.]MDP2804174.1 GNAT family N-acetyltransferase [Phreatobacter sp.]